MEEHRQETGLGSPVVPSSRLITHCYNFTKSFMVLGCEPYLLLTDITD